MRKLILGVGAIALCGAIPSVATAHNASVICTDNQYVVRATDPQLSPTWTFDESFATVRWSDGFTKRVPLPVGCTEPTPAPVPPVPEVVPPPAVVPPAPPVVVEPPKPPTCAELLARYPKAGPVRRANWGCPAPPVLLKPPRMISTRYYPCPGVGKRSKMVITVTTSSGKTGRVTKWGKVCKLPAVTG